MLLEQLEPRKVTHYYSIAFHMVISLFSSFMFVEFFGHFFLIVAKYMQNKIYHLNDFYVYNSVAFSVSTLMQPSPLGISGAVILNWKSLPIKQ